VIAPDTAYKPSKQPLNAPPIPQKALTLSRKVDECKPLPVFSSSRTASILPAPAARGLHSSTFQLNVSAFPWDKGCVQGVFRGC